MQVPEKDRETIRAGVHISAKRVVIRAAMQVSAMKGNYQKQCACIAKETVVIRGGAHVSAKTVRLSEMVCMYQTTEKFLPGIESKL